MAAEPDSFFATLGLFYDAMYTVFGNQYSIFMKWHRYTISSATCEWFPSCRLPEHIMFHPTLHRSAPRQVSWSYCKCLCNLAQLLLPSIKRCVSCVFFGLHFGTFNNDSTLRIVPARGADRSGRISSNLICAWNIVECEYWLLCHHRCHHFQSNVR